MHSHIHVAYIYVCCVAALAPLADANPPPLAASEPPAVLQVGIPEAAVLQVGIPEAATPAALQVGIPDAATTREPPATAEEPLMASTADASVCAGGGVELIVAAALHAVR
jgi:hypothetical protein